MNAQNADKPVKPQRRWDIDWLRVLAVLLLFPFHTARIFNIGEEFYVKNELLSSALSYLVIYFSPWHMPLFFVLAGASTWFALRFRGGGQYVVERVKRLLVPFIFGVLVLIPPQSYLGLRFHNSDYTASYLSWLPRFFQVLPKGDEDYFLGTHTWGQLWFIIHLFVYSLVALPLFLYFNRESGRRVINWLAAFCTRPGAIFLFSVVILLATSDPDVAGGQPLTYLTFFILGYILMADARFGEAVDRHRLAALLLGPVPLLALPVFYLAGWSDHIPAWAAEAIGDYFESFASWFTLIAMLAYGRRFLNFTNGFLKYAAEASYPYYILHQTAIVMIGFYVVRWETGVLVKFVTIMLGALAVTAVVYDLVVKQTNVTRFLFGMRPLKKKVPATPPPRAKEAVA
jgi:glucan biosynthesis protein C